MFSSFSLSIFISQHSVPKKIISFKELKELIVVILAESVEFAAFSDITRLYIPTLSFSNLSSQHGTI